MMVKSLSDGSAPDDVMAQVSEALKVLARNHLSNKEAILASGGTKVQHSGCQSASAACALIFGLLRLFSFGVVSVLARMPRFFSPRLCSYTPQALLQLLALNMETDLGLITSAAWAVNNLVHKSPANVEQVVSSRGVQLLLRIIRTAEVRYISAIKFYLHAPSSLAHGCPVPC